MIDKRYWSITGSINREKLEGLLAHSRENGVDPLVTIDVSGEKGPLPVVFLADGTYDGETVNAEFSVQPEATG